MIRYWRGYYKNIEIYLVLELLSGFLLIFLKSVWFWCISDSQFLASSDRYRPDIIIPEIFIIKCNLVCKKIWIKAQCQTTKRNKNFQARIKSCNKWFVDRIGIYPRPQRLDWAQSSHWLAELLWQLFIGDSGQPGYLVHWIKIKSRDI